MFIGSSFNFPPTQFQQPLGYVDVNIPYRRQTLQGYSKLQSEGMELLKKRSINALDYAPTQIQSNVSTKIRLTYKQNQSRPCPQSPTNICFSFKNTPHISHKMRIHKPPIESLSSETAKRPSVIQLIQNPLVESFQLDIKSYVAKNKARQSVGKRMQQNQPMNLKQSDFTKIRQLGKGKFGTVYLVRHKESNFICALKIIKKDVVRQQKIQHQVAKQIRIHNSLRHINIISFYGYFHDQHHFYILTEFATGPQIYSLLKIQHRLSQKQTSKIVRQTADGLQMMHNLGYIHRDIKPQNLVLQFNTVKICDLGWAAECSGNKMRKSVCGTPLYYSPELVKNVPYNCLIDVWCLGLLAYELIVGRIPFKIWSEFDLPVILSQEVQFPDYIEVQDQTKMFILNCLTKISSLRPAISMLKDYSFMSRRADEYSQILNAQIQYLF